MLRFAPKKHGRGGSKWAVRTLQAFRPAHPLDEAPRKISENQKKPAGGAYVPRVPVGMYATVILLTCNRPLTRPASR
jgi:hypothetical protein